MSVLYRGFHLQRNIASYLAWISCRFYLSSAKESRKAMKYSMLSNKKVGLKLPKFMKFRRFFKITTRRDFSLLLVVKGVPLKTATNLGVTSQVNPFQERISFRASTTANWIKINNNKAIKMVNSFSLRGGEL